MIVYFFVYDYPDYMEKGVENEMGRVEESVFGSFFKSMMKTNSIDLFYLDLCCLCIVYKKIIRSLCCDIVIYLSQRAKIEREIVMKFVYASRCCFVDFRKVELIFIRFNIDLSI